MVMDPALSATRVKLKIRKMAGSLGAEVRGLDVAGGLDPQTVKALREAFLQHQVIVLRDQTLSPAQQVQFARYFGEPIVHPLYPSLPGHPELLEIKNAGKKRSLTEIWHTDTSSLERPPAITMLHAKVIPEAGGDTMFANQYDAYEGLSSGLKTLVAGLRAVHTSASETNMHPVVRTHHETGRRALFVNAYFVRTFENMTEAESRPLLGFLFSVAASPEYTYRHAWSVGDLLMWDNRCVQHYAIHDYGDARREMHRAMIEGDRPV